MVGLDHVPIKFNNIPEGLNKSAGPEWPKGIQLAGSFEGSSPSFDTRFVDK
jgi:hypothetical protein